MCDSRSSERYHWPVVLPQRPLHQGFFKLNSRRSGLSAIVFYLSDSVRGSWTCIAGETQGLHLACQHIGQTLAQAPALEPKPIPSALLCR